MGIGDSFKIHDSLTYKKQKSFISERFLFYYFFNFCFSKGSILSAVPFSYWQDSPTVPYTNKFR